MSIVLRPIEPREYESARALWDIVFPEDAGGFSAYYFRARTRPEYILGAFDGQTMVGGLHAVPYPLRFGKNVVPCAMVGGVATLPAYRRRGIAAALIEMAHARLLAQGIPAALLKPDAHIYERFGYLPFAYHDEYELSAAQAAAFPQSPPFEAEPSQMLTIYDAFAKNYAGMMARTERDMALYREEAQLSGIAVTDGQAYALAAAGESGIDVLELVGEDPLPLVAALARSYSAARFRLPAGMLLPGLALASRMMFSMICALDEAAFCKASGAASMRALLAGELGPCCTLEFC